MKNQQDCKRSCIDCHVCNCDTRDKLFPDFCPGLTLDDQDLARVIEVYTQDEENRTIALASAQVEAEFYCRMTRIEEIGEFAKRIGAKKLGIATCVGLIQEARIAAKILRKKGFEVFGAGCKVGSLPKTSIGVHLTPEAAENVGDVMCNPILQARLLNREQTDLNIVVGLCVGHDSLFYKYSEALCTTLVTKDRVLCHNPAAALYQADKYYSRLLED